MVQPVVSECERGDLDDYVRIRSYRAFAGRNPAGAILSLLPIGIPFGGPRNLLWQSIISRNCGANHLMAIADPAHKAVDCTARLQAAELQRSYAKELGVRMIEPQHVNSGSRNRSVSSIRTKSSSVSKRKGEAQRVDQEFTRSLQPRKTRKVMPAPTQALGLSKPGFCIWITGLPSAGKSTIAAALTSRLMEIGIEVTLLDGDIVRTHLSKGLGFSRADRDTNILRIGFVASEIVKHQGAVICAAVSPYRATRNRVRNMMRKDTFIEVFVDTPVTVCESRDVKGLYAKARAGELKGFTGIDDPYEPPVDPEIVVQTTAGCGADDNAGLILQYLAEKNCLRENALTRDGDPGFRFRMKAHNG